MCVLYWADDFKYAVGNTQLCADVCHVYLGLIVCMLWIDRCCCSVAQLCWPGLVAMLLCT